MMIDLKTAIIMAGAVFLIWSCSGVSAQEPTAMSGPVDKDACYAAALATVRDAWPSLERMDRALLGAQAIQICEGGQP